MIGMGKGQLPAVGVVCLVCVACGMGVAGRPAPRSVTFHSSDNTLLAATYYPVSNPTPPGLILVHGERGNRKDWAPWAVRAQREGIATIAVDLRGHGQSDRPEAWPSDPAASGRY